MDLLKAIDNLNLETYDPHIHEFYMKASHLFQFDKHIFKKQVKDPFEVYEDAMSRSYDNEYKITRNYLKSQYGSRNQKKVSPERIQRILKYLPPF